MNLSIKFSQFALFTTTWMSYNLEGYDERELYETIMQFSRKGPRVL